MASTWRGQPTIPLAARGFMKHRETLSTMVLRLVLPLPTVLSFRGTAAPRFPFTETEASSSTQPHSLVGAE
jgi:hypothetical protein